MLDDLYLWTGLRLKSELSWDCLPVVDRKVRESENCYSSQVGKMMVTALTHITICRSTWYPGEFW